MTQADKDLLIKDLCARLPYKVKVQDTYYKSLEPAPIWLLDLHAQKVRLFADEGYQSIEYIKPYLFPLSSITEEQIKELSKLGVSYCEYALHDDIRGLGIMIDEAYIFFEFCYKHHIDFLGLIDMGLALDATKLNVY
jgi:hypothetical protein